MKTEHGATEDKRLRLTYIASLDFKHCAHVQSKRWHYRHDSFKFDIDNWLAGGRGV